MTLHAAIRLIRIAAEKMGGAVGGRANDAVQIGVAAGGRCQDRGAVAGKIVDAAENHRRPVNRFLTIHNDRLGRVWRMRRHKMSRVPSVISPAAINRKARAASAVVLDQQRVVFAAHFEMLDSLSLQVVPAHDHFAGKPISTPLRST